MKWMISAIVAVIACVMYLQPVQALNYGTNAYGSCQYNTCSITLTANSTITANVTPAGSATTCTVVSDTVGVRTGASSGYTLTVSNNDGATSLIGSNGGAVTASSGTAASPIALQVNKWGYRVNNQSGFGAGPTTTGANTGVPANAYAGIPPFSTPDTIDSTFVAASVERTTDIYYGLCLDTTIPNGTYSDSIVYTAVIN